MKPEALYEKLIEYGCPEEFAEQAIQHAHLFTGNVEHFVGLIEEISEAGNKPATTLMDEGSRKVEHNYTGDNLTTGGFDHIDKNRRW